MENYFEPLLSFLSLLVTIFLGLIVLRVDNRVGKVQHNTNSMHETIVRLEKAVSLQQGILEGRAEQKLKEAEQKGN